MHWAARKGRLEATRYLLNKGVSVNQLNKSQRTPLHEAANNGYPEIVKTLLEAKACTTFWDASGKTAMQLAEDNLSKSNSAAKVEDYQKIITMLETEECKIQ